MTPPRARPAWFIDAPSVMATGEFVCLKVVPHRTRHAVYSCSEGDPTWTPLCPPRPLDPFVTVDEARAFP